MTIGQPGAVDSEPDLLEQLVPVDSLEQVENVGRFSAAVLDALPSHIAILAADGSIMAVNGAWERFAVENSGTDVGVGQDYLHVCDAAAARGDVVAAEAADLLRSVLSRRESVATLTYPCHSPSKQRWFLMRAAQLDVREGCAVVQHSEITEWMLADADAALKTRLLADVRSAVVVEDVDGLIAHWNDAATVVYGWSPEEVLGRTASDVLGRSPEWDAIRRAVEGGGGWSGLVRASRKNGSQVVVDIRCWTLRDADGLPGPVAWIAEDVTERVRKAEELRSARDLARAITESVPEGVFALDDGGRLTYMNVEAERLLGWSREELHGEPMHNVTHYQAASGAPLRREDCPITRTREAGEVVEVAEDTFVRRDGSLFPVAYKASPFALGDGRLGSVVVFRDITEEKAERERRERELAEFAWAARVREALTEGRFVLHAQPIVDLASGKVAGHELLIRMPTGNELAQPGSFLPAAEKHRLTAEIDQWVLAQACELTLRGLSVAVNVSAHSLADRNLVNVLKRRLDEGSGDARKLTIEVTETALLANARTAALVLQGFAELGCRVALDDFGTGYGGFSYLKSLPFDYLKIDREFVSDLTSNDASRAVVEAITGLARAFGQKTIAEGVETEEALEVLRALQVDYAQGYLFGRPSPVVLMREE